MRKKITIILTIIAFVYGFVAGTQEHKELYHQAMEGWWSFLYQNLQEDIQELRNDRHEQVRESIRAYRQQKVELAQKKKEEIAAKISLEPEKYEPEKRIVLTEVKYPNLTIIAQDADKNRMTLGAAEAELIPRIIAALPQKALNSFEQIIIQYGNPPNMRRGMAGGGVMIVKDASSMRGGNKEFIGVFTHEAGHVIDINYMKGSPNAQTTAFKDGHIPLYENDPSVTFYSYNWDTDKSLREDADNKNFPSRYAMSDSFEDFAEVFNAFVTQPEALRAIASKNSILQAHYNFIKDRLFDGGEFVANVDETQLDRDPRVWDTTVMPITNLVVDSRIYFNS
jgi:hypothetical protein